MKKSLIILSCVLTAFCLSGCKKEKSQTTYTNSINLSISKSDSSNLVSEPQKWHITDKKICVMFGYDFNKPEVYEPLLAELQKKFGLDEDGGLICPVIYPNDFKHGVRGYANDFMNYLQDDSKDFIGVVVLGAPENTHTALARNQDKWNREVPYPVIALFPQDDVLGLESTCDIVLDKGQTAAITGEIQPEETEGQFIEESPEVLMETINYIQCLNYALKKDNSVQTHILQMLNGRNIHHYLDPETGLQSINHFVLN